MSGARTIRRGGRNDRRRPRDLMRVNQRIRVPEVRVVMDDGEQKGIMVTKDAMALAQELGLDLVEIAARSHPPVCRIMDYGKYKYEQSKKKKQAKKHASTVELKEIKFRPKTDGHDRDFKIKHVRRFVEEGNKCRLVIIFRGREITHPETGRDVLDKVVEATQDIANVEVHPNMEGRRMVMILAPKAGVVRRSRQAKDDGGNKSKGERKESKGKGNQSQTPGDSPTPASGDSDAPSAGDSAAADAPSASDSAAADAPSSSDSVPAGP